MLPGYTGSKVRVGKVAHVAAKLGRKQWKHPNHTSWWPT